MPQTELSPNVEKTVSSERKSLFEKADEAVDVLRRSESLFELKRQGVSTTEAIEATALSLSESSDKNLSESEKSLFGVIGHLSSFVIARRRADEMQSSINVGEWSYDDRREMTALKKGSLIPFNHAVKEFINTIPSSAKDELDASVARLYMRLFYLNDPLVKDVETHGLRLYDLEQNIQSDVIEKVSQSTDGMRNEIAAESILSAAGYSYEYNVSDDEDAHGADLFVYLESGWTHVDIKSSRKSAERALDQHANSHAVWTGLNPSSFTGPKGDQSGGLTIPFETALSHADKFIARIEAVANR